MPLHPSRHSVHRIQQFRVGKTNLPVDECDLVGEALRRTLKELTYDVHPELHCSILVVRP
jgi:hypothetical protein